MWGYFDLDYLDPLEDIRQAMTDINPQNPAIGVVDMTSSLHSGNYDGTLESAQWVWEGLGRPPWYQRILAFIHAINGDDAAAKAAFEAAAPNYFQREHWRAAIEESAPDGCFAALLLMRTGDSKLGEDLARFTIDYFENELPLYIEHSDRFIVDDCYIAVGQIEDALVSLETRLEHRHYKDFWFYKRSPHFELLWSEPRYQAAMKRAEDDITAQRAELIRSETATL